MVGFWRMKSNKGWVSHGQGLTEESLKFFRSLKVGDKLVVFENEVRDGERHPHLTLKRSTLNA